MSRHQPLEGADSPDAAVTYRVPLRSLDSDHTFARLIRVYGPKDLSGQLKQLEADFPGYSLGRPVPV